MGMRFRKSVNLGGGVRLNLNKKSVSVSAGAKGARVTVNSKGQRTSTVSAPGTGLSYRATSSTEGTARAGSSPTLTPQLATPGRFAPRAEKALYAAVQAGLGGAHPESWLTVFCEWSNDPKFGFAAQTLGGLIAFARQVDPIIARDLLDQSLHSRLDPAVDPFIVKYASFGLNVTAVGREYPYLLGRDLVAMAVTVLYERAGNHAQAALAADQLTPSPLHRVVQLEHALELENYQRVLAMTDALPNHGELDAMALVLRGIALRDVGDSDAALTTFTAAKLTAAQDPEVRYRGLLERARIYAERGQVAKARKDLNTIVAWDSDYPGVREAIALLDA